MCTLSVTNHRILSTGVPCFVLFLGVQEVLTGDPVGPGGPLGPMGPWEEDKTTHKQHDDNGR